MNICAEFREILSVGGWTNHWPTEGFQRAAYSREEEQGRLEEFSAETVTQLYPIMDRSCSRYRGLCRANRQLLLFRA